MPREEDNYKEGVDFEWRKASNGNYLTRHFFTKAEKEAMKAPKKEAPKKEAAKPAPKKAKEAPVAKSAAVPKVTTTKLDKEYSGRGDGLTEMARRAIDRADTKSPKDYTYQQWRSMSRDERKKAGLPVSEIGGQLEFKRFLSGFTGKDYTATGMSKGGATKKSGYAKGGYVNCGASMKPNGKAKK